MQQCIIIFWVCILFPCILHCQTNVNYYGTSSLNFSGLNLNDKILLDSTAVRTDEKSHKTVYKYGYKLGFGIELYTINSFKGALELGLSSNRFDYIFEDLISHDDIVNQIASTDITSSYSLNSLMTRIRISHKLTTRFSLDISGSFHRFITVKSSSEIVNKIIGVQDPAKIVDLNRTDYHSFSFGCSSYYSINQKIGVYLGIEYLLSDFELDNFENNKANIATFKLGVRYYINNENNNYSI